MLTPRISFSPSLVSLWQWLADHAAIFFRSTIKWLMLIGCCGPLTSNASVLILEDRSYDYVWFAAGGGSQTPVGNIAGTVGEISLSGSGFYNYDAFDFNNTSESGRRFTIDFRVFGAQSFLLSGSVDTTAFGSVEIDLYRLVAGESERVLGGDFGYGFEQVDLSTDLQAGDYSLVLGPFFGGAFDLEQANWNLTAEFAIVPLPAGGWLFLASLGVLQSLRAHALSRLFARSR